MLFPPLSSRDVKSGPQSSSPHIPFLTYNNQTDIESNPSNYVLLDIYNEHRPIKQPPPAAAKRI